MVPPAPWIFQLAYLDEIELVALLGLEGVVQLELEQLWSLWSCATLSGLTRDRDMLRMLRYVIPGIATSTSSSFRSFYVIAPTIH